MDNFTQPGWDKCVESNFTKVSNTAGALLSESGATGDKKVVVEGAELWSHGLMAGKLFMRHHTNYAKAHHKVAYVEPMLAPLVDFDQFLQKTGRSAAPSLKRRLLKVQGHTQAKGFAKVHV